eukprot:TRINITY_DN404_c0_g1_i1.p1 TRINITY_DN404_c0_g1~~TRINITY_DN404_c0_g1_i1.p1  ORF type:complete len:350 (-),score=71.11 TRINITY_DN404_c0_g1_i1:187-1236(-)
MPLTFSSEQITGMTWCVIWLTLNCGTTLLNKALFKLFSFPFPVVVSLIHMIFTFTCSLITIKLFKYPTKTLTQEQHIKIALFSGLFCANIVVGNLGIRYATVALSQVIRAIIPGVTMILSILILSKKYTRNHVIAISIVVIGVSLATYGDLNFNVVGFVLVVVGCCLSSLKSITTSIFLVGDLKFHPLELACRMAFYAIPQMFILSIFLGEYSKITSDFWEDYYNKELIIILCVNGTMAFLLNFSNFMFNRSTSALTVTVAGSVKNVLTILLSIVIFVTPISFINAIGTVVAITGAASYSGVEYKYKKIRNAPSSSSNSDNDKDLKINKEDEIDNIEPIVDENEDKNKN